MTSKSRSTILTLRSDQTAEPRYQRRCRGQGAREGSAPRTSLLVGHTRRRDNSHCGSDRFPCTCGFLAALRAIAHAHPRRGRDPRSRNAASSSTCGAGSRRCLQSPAASGQRKPNQFPPRQPISKRRRVVAAVRHALDVPPSVASRRCVGCVTGRGVSMPSQTSSSARPRSTGIHLPALNASSRHPRVRVLRRARSVALWRWAWTRAKRGKRGRRCGRLRRSRRMRPRR